MDSNLIFFGLGVLISVPLSVLANLATPKVGDWLGERSERWRQRNEEKARNREHLITALTSEPHLLAEYMISRHSFVIVGILLALGILILAVSLPVQGMIADVYHETTNIPHYWRYVFSVGGALFAGVAVSQSFLKQIEATDIERAVQHRRAEAGLPYVPSRHVRSGQWQVNGEKIKPPE